MLRGGRLPLPQSPLPRWRTTAPAPGLRRATSAALFLSTTTRRRNDHLNDKPPTAEPNRANGKAAQGGGPRHRISKIGVYGDDWLLVQEKSKDQQWNKHAHLSLQGKKPFGDRIEYQEDIAATIARARSPKFWKRADPPHQAEQAEQTYFDKPDLGQGRVTSRNRNEYEQHVAATDASTQSLKVPKCPDPPQQRWKPKHYHFRKLKPHKRKRTPADWGKVLYNRRLRLNDDAPGQVSKKHQPRHRAPQFKDRPDTHRLRAGQPQGTASLKVKLDSRTEMPPKVQAAITRQYKLVASERKPLFDPRLPSAPDAPSAQVPPQAKPIHLAQYSDELAVAAADIGPAESSQRSFIEDPVLMKAKSLAESHLTTPSKLEMSSRPRFRLVPSWGPTPEKTPRTPQLPRDEPKSLESQISELQMMEEANGQKNQPRRISDARPSTPESLGPEQSEIASDVGLKAAPGRPQVDTQDSLTMQDEGPTADAEADKVVEPVPSPAPDNRTIFEKLFAEQERTRGTDRAQMSSRLKATLAARKEKPVGADQQNMLGTAAQDEDNSRHQNVLNANHGLSIFRQLFPEHAGPETTRSEPEISPDTHEILNPPEDSVMVSLRNEVRNWVAEEGQAQMSWPKVGDYGSHSTVVVIAGTSPSLMDTDFYRIAPEGRHVEGWAGGLVKVIQAHDSVSYEPLGQYYLMFHSRPSALAYVNEVRRLHELSRRLLHAPGGSGREAAKGSLDKAPAAPQPFLTDEERAAIRSFTLFSPHITPHISVRMWNTELVQALAAKSNIADVLPTLRPEGATPARVLLKLTSPDGQHGEGQGGLTTDELWLTLRDDGRERSAPWVLANLSEGIMPVKPKFTSEPNKITVKAEPVSMPLELGGDDDDHIGDGLHGAGGPVVAPSPPPRKGADGNVAVDRKERFRRFVLTFAQPAIARRFVRCWHKRVVYDALLQRSVVIDAVAIM